MANSESEAECSVKQKPQLFAAIPSPSDDERSLCQLDSPDSHVVLIQEVTYIYTPPGYHRYSEHEEYLVVPMACEEDVNLDVSQPQKKRKTNRGRAIDTTETDTPSSEESTTAEHRMTKRRAASIHDSVKEYGGDDENESGASDASTRCHQNDPFKSKTVTKCVSHKKFCTLVTRYRRHQYPVSLPIITVPRTGVKLIQCELHCRGLDCDFFERSATFTAILQLSSDSLASNSSYECTVDIRVNVYEGKVTENACLLGNARKRVVLTRDEQKLREKPIVVNKIVKLDKIVYNEKCPNEIGLQIEASVATIRKEPPDHVRLASDSGCVDASRSGGT